MTTRGEQLAAIMRRLDKAGEEWELAGFPDDGPTVDARKAVFAELRAWNARTAGDYPVVSHER